MFFAEEPMVVATWWATLMQVPAQVIEADNAFACFTVAGLEFGFHPADPARNPVGGSPVIYLNVEDHAEAVARAGALGARLHRGPIDIAGSRTIVQMSDPFGNIFGLDGPTA